MSNIWQFAQFFALRLDMDSMATSSSILPAGAQLLSDRGYFPSQVSNDVLQRSSPAQLARLAQSQQALQQVDGLLGLQSASSGDVVSLSPTAQSLLETLGTPAAQSGSTANTATSTAFSELFPTYGPNGQPSTGPNTISQLG